MSEPSNTGSQETQPSELRTFEVVAVAVGGAIVSVQAHDEDEAVSIAYTEYLTGIDIGCGVANWEVDYVREVET